MRTIVKSTAIAVLMLSSLSAMGQSRIKPASAQFDPSQLFSNFSFSSFFGGLSSPAAPAATATPSTTATSTDSGVDIAKLRDMFGALDMNVNPAQLGNLDISKILNGLDLDKLQEQVQACAQAAIPSEADLSASIDACVGNIDYSNVTPDNIQAIIDTTKACAENAIPNSEDLVKEAQKCVTDLIGQIDISKFLK